MAAYSEIFMHVWSYCPSYRADHMGSLSMEILVGIVCIIIIIATARIWLPIVIFVGYYGAIVLVLGLILWWITTW